jgi:CelD/BcsL family acetyltransferase involved in cellulose biosynthesis
VNVEIIEAARVSSYLDDPEFLQSWSDLSRACPWATIYQSVDFCKIWYECYADLHSPLLVTGRDSGRLIGLLPLAVNKRDGKITWAGDYHAEYHTWLSSPEFGIEFIESALDALASVFSASLTFLYMAPGTPIEWLEPHRRWGQSAALRKLDRPLMSTDPQWVDESLRKKNNRSKLNRLRKMGDFEFKVLQSVEELEAIFDEVMLFKRYRHLAVHGQERPAFDRRKRAFYLKTMERGLLHASVMTLDGRLVSAHIGNRNNAEVLLGILSHSPFFAAHSPGKLHLLLLASKLCQEGVRTFDLTPGGEYKDRFATHSDEVWFAVVFFRQRDFLSFKLKQKLTGWAKKSALEVRVNPSGLQRRIARLRGQWRLTRWSVLPAQTLTGLRHQFWYQAECRIYRTAPGDAETLPDVRLVRRDSIADLLAFPSRHPDGADFIEHSLALIESGAHPYTLVEDGKLIQCSWVDETRKLDLPEVGQTWHPPEGSVVLIASYTDPAAQRRDLSRMALCQMLRESAAIPGTKHLFVAIIADNRPFREIVEGLGLRHEYSFFKATRLFRSRRWTSAMNSATIPALVAEL